MKKKYPKVNTYNAELKLEKYIEEAMKCRFVRKPISYALYYTWKWANENEEEREIDDD